MGKAVKVITFVLAVLALPVLAFWFFAPERGGTYQVWGLFTNAIGLVEKAKVQVAGLAVGHIASRVLDPKYPGKAKVTITLHNSVILYKNAELRKRQASLLGEIFLEIRPGSPMDPKTRASVARLADGDEVPVEFEDSARAAAETNLPEVLRGILRETRRITSGPAKEGVRDITRAIRENGRALAKLLQDADAGVLAFQANVRARRPEVIGLIQDVRAATQEIESQLAQGGTVEAKTRAFQAELDRVKEMTDKVDKALAEFDAVATQTNRGEGDLGKMLKDPSYAQDLADATHEAAGFVNSFAEFRTLVGLRTEYTAFADGIKTYLQIQFEPKADKYYLVELVSDPIGFRRESIVLSRSSDPTRPRTVSDKKIEITDEFRFTLQFAKRIGIWTGRFGLKESTGGLGADLRWYRDRAEIQTDLFDFRANVFPRLKVTAAFQFLRYLYVVGGLDDVLNTRSTARGGRGRDYFFGAMLRFNDEDLRNLLMLGGGTLNGTLQNQ